MKNKNYYFLIAGAICLATALLHTIGGQLDLVNPLMNSSLEKQTKTELQGAWHMVTVLLFFSAYVLLSSGIYSKAAQSANVKLVAWLFILFGGVFISVSISNGVFAPQWILCFPIGILGLMGLRKSINS